MVPGGFALKIMKENEISKVIVDSAIEVHRELGGPGLLEGVYEEALVEELTKRGLKVERQLQVPIVYKGKKLGVMVCKNFATLFLCVFALNFLK